MSASLIGRLLNLLTYGRHLSSARTLENGETAELWLARDGSVVVSKIDPARLIEYTSGALATSGQISNSAARLIELHVHNRNANERFLHLFNLTAVPVAGTTPRYPLAIPGNSSASITFDARMTFATGIVWACSTTFDELAISETSDLWVQAWKET